MNQFYIFIVNHNYKNIPEKWMKYSYGNLKEINNKALSEKNDNQPTQQNWYP